MLVETYSVNESLYEFFFDGKEKVCHFPSFTDPLSSLNITFAFGYEFFFLFFFSPFGMH